MTSCPAVGKSNLMSHEISHVWVTIFLCFMMSPAQNLSYAVRLSLICIEINLYGKHIFVWMVSHVDSFWHREATQKWSIFLQFVVILFFPQKLRAISLLVYYRVSAGNRWRRTLLARNERKNAKSGKTGNNYMWNNDLKIKYFTGMQFWSLVLLLENLMNCNHFHP